jgi:CubicO group peptidase (beta-lactamase class C family)
MESEFRDPDRTAEGLSAQRFSRCLVRATTLVLVLALGLGLDARRGHLAHAQADPAVTVDACVRSEMAGGIHGAQLAVARDGQILFERAYGRKHRDRTDPVDSHTQFRIGSTTKAMTALAILQQVDQGVLDLDAPITRYLPGFELAAPGQASRITLRHLLTHASGLHDTSAKDESDLFGPTDAGALTRWVAAQQGSTPYAPPGRFWNYSSANYMYAGQILERVTGLSYPDYMDSRVFAPAGMADSTLHAETAVQRGNFAYGHFRNPFSGRLEIYDLNQANNWARHPAGYANSTAGDLVRFASLLMKGGGDVLSATSARAMQSRERFQDLGRDQYNGLGTWIDYFQGNEVISHDGGAWGWTATMRWIPAAGIAVASVTNTGDAALYGATNCALAAYVKAGPPRTTVCRQDRGSWDDYVGTYEGSSYVGEAWTMTVSRPVASGDLRLHVERTNNPDLDATLTQSCAVWVDSGPGSFQATGIGVVSFVADPVEPDRLWLRHRQFVGSRALETPAMPRVYLPWLGRAAGRVVR